MVDTHLHLDDERFEGLYEQIIADFNKDGIDFVINNSVDYKTMLFGFDLAQAYERVYCTLGVHPHEAANYDETFITKAIELAPNKKVVAVGEIGLDYFYDFCDKKTQKDVFAAQIELADKLKLPLTLHIRDAYSDLEDILTAEKRYLNSGVLLHCYSGSAELARQYAKRGYYFSFGGAVTFKKNRKSDVLSAIPVTQVVTETDAPYLTPEPNRGKLNLPKYIAYVLPVMAQVYGVTVEQMEAQVKVNALRYFNKIQL